MVNGIMWIIQQWPISRNCLDQLLKTITKYSLRVESISASKTEERKAEVLTTMP
jgi:hypothetical protein